MSVASGPNRSLKFAALTCTQTVRDSAEET